MAPAYDDAKIHLDVLGCAREVDLSVRVGPASVADLLPTARAVSAAVSEVALERAHAAGRSVSCKAGCGACCRQIVPIAVVEAVRLAEVVAAMPEERAARVRARFSEAVRRMEELGILVPGERGRSALVARGPGSAWEDVSHRYFRAGIPCPFLEDESCGIYQERPVVCREYNVTSPPAACAAFSPEIQVIERPVRMNEALAEATNALLDRKDLSIPLTLALEWAESHAAELAPERDGEEVFRALLAAVAAAAG